MPYGKIQNGMLQKSPSIIKHNGRTYINPTASILEAEGYVRLTFAPCPAADDGYCYREAWTEDGVQHWELVEDTSSEALMKKQINEVDEVAAMAYVNSELALAMLEV